MDRRPGWCLAALLAVSGCAHQPLSAGDAARMLHPAFISRIVEGAGPVSTVFRDDPSAYAEKLKKLDPQEADRRFANSLANGFDIKVQGGDKTHVPTMNRFEIADTLRTQVLMRLPNQRPWSALLDATQVAHALQSYLVEEVPANAPDYDRLLELGGDSVVEIIVERYGVRAEKGKAGIFLVGTARIFRIGGGTLYLRKFVSDELAAGLPGLDPFEIARKNPQPYLTRLHTMLVAIAIQIAKDLTVDDVGLPPDKAGETPTDEAPKKYFEKKKDESEEAL